MMSFRVLKAVVVLVAVALVSPAVIGAQGSGTIIGVIRSQSDKSAVEGATVRVEEQLRATISDRNGRFRLPGLTPGSVTLQVQRLGFATRRVDAVVHAGSTDEIEVVLVEAPSLVNTMTITASRTREEVSRDLPVSVSSISGQELTQMRPSHVAQPLNRVAGVHLTEFEGGGSYSSVRQPMCCRSTLLFMEDGIPFTSPAYYSPNYVGLVNFAQAGQIDVLKGPGTAAYGSDAVTGVINFVSAMAPLAPAASVVAEAGGADYRRLMMNAGGTFGVHNLSVAVNAAGASGRRENPYSTLATSLRWQTTLRNGASLRTLVSFNKRDGTGADDQTPQQFASRSSFNPFPVAFDNWRTVRASTNYSQSRGKTSWSFTPFVRYEDTDRVPGWQLSYDPVVWQVTTSSAGLLSQVRHDFGGSYAARVTAGIDLDLTPGHRREPVISPVSQGGVWVDYSLNALPPHYDYKMVYRGAAAYTQLEFEPLQQLRISAGVRYDASHYNYDNQLTTVQTGLFRRPADTTLSYDGISPKLGAVYSIGTNHRVFTSFRRGFRIPIEQQLFKQGGSENTVGLQPVQVSSWDLGFRSRVADRISYEVAAYTMHLDNDVLSVREPNGISTLTNNGRTAHRGIELTSSVSLSQTVRLDVAVTQALHTFNRWVPSPSLNYSGNEMDAAPRSLRNAVLSYQPRFLGGGQVELDYAGIGSYWLDGANSLRQGGSDLLHLRAGWIVAKRWEVYGRLMNITDRLYAAEAFPGFGGVQRVMNPGEYRTLYAGVRARF